MIITFKKGLPWLCKFMLLSILFVSVFQVNSVMAQDQEIFNTQERLAIINFPAYSIISEVNNESNDIYTKEFEQNCLSMTDKEFEAAVHKNIEKVIKKKEAGAIIKWNKESIDYIKLIASDLIPTIEKQIKEDSFIKSGDEYAFLSYTPGSDSETWVIYDYNVLNIKLYAFCQQISWGWNSSQITSVSSRAYSRIFAPLWTYEGINDESHQYNDNYFSYSQYHEGHFSGQIAGYPIVNTYPYLYTTVITGGDWEHDEGFN